MIALVLTQVSTCVAFPEKSSSGKQLHKIAIGDKMHTQKKLLYVGITFSRAPLSSVQLKTGFSRGC